MLPEKVIIGLSGGVDSSVAAWLLKKEGYDVEGLFMRNWDSAINNDHLGNPSLDHMVCPQERDFEDAKKVADQLGIQLHRHDFVEQYWNDVFSYFLDQYKKGRTPNPDILCNKYIKFESFREVAMELGADKIAMGHYARVRRKNNETQLLRGVDRNKDQTYFLCQLNQEQLRDTLFPIGHLKKDDVRDLASRYHIPTADKKDSTGICFIGERDFAKFLSNYIPAQPGEIKTFDDDVIGKHDGLMYYTIGQRKGLGIGGLTDYDNKPWFVAGKDMEKNVLYVVQGVHHPKLYSDSCIVKDVNWISESHFSDKRTVTVKFRYRQIDHPAIIEWIDDETISVSYPKQARAVTPGQACVFYDEEVCLGGGTIDQVFMDDIERLY